MKKIYLSKSLVRLLAVAAICTLLPGSVLWAEEEVMFPFGVVVVPPPDLNPLNQTPVPEPPQLGQYVKNKAAAIRLGKALFWDMQAGSDGIVACATCHFSAGADNRLKNTLNPGTNAGDGSFGNNSLGVQGFSQFGPNYTLNPETDFPFHQRQAPADMRTSPVARDTNDIVGSQGVRLSDFTGVVQGSAIDSVLSSETDPVFNLAGVNLRRVTGRNAPSVINAIFNFTNFWDGRANFIFNGENPFGPLDRDAGVWFNEAGVLVKRPVTIEFASLASQATGPALDPTEMSGRGRTFPDLGKKMLGLTPLGKQLVHPGDSILGPLSNAVRNPDGTYTGNGINITYGQMIRDAFRDNLWSSTLTTPGGFTQMQANFSLFWGLAIQLYEATLVSDDTPFDRWLAGDTAALTEEQRTGFSLFLGIGNCVVCHAGTELTNSSAANINFLNNFENATTELMFVSDGSMVLYDEGFNNTAVAPTTDDLGRGGTAPFINFLTGEPYPLSFSALAILQAQNLLPFSTPILDPFIPIDIPINKNGLFKSPGLRNVELTAPFFHNGSVMNLEDVIDFYVRGGNFRDANIADLDPVVGAGLSIIQGNETMKAAMVAFLKSLTDERVRNQSAPFDHPELFIPEGYPEVLKRIPATAANGEAAQPSALTLNPVFTPTNLSTQVISGTVAEGSIPSVTVDTSAVAGPVTVSGSNWEVSISGLVEGNNIITVQAVVNSSNITLTSTITLDTVPPALALNPVTTPTNLSTQSISGTVEAGAAVTVSVNGSAPVSAVVSGTSWSFLAALIQGVNTLDVTAADGAGNTSSLPSAEVFASIPDAITVDRSTYSRSIEGRVDVWATAPSDAVLDVSGGPGLSASPVPLTGNGAGKFFVRIAVPNPAALPASVTVTSNRGLLNQTEESSLLTDIVSVTQAEYNLATGVLTIRAASSDKVAPPNGPVLSAEGLGNLSSGTLTVSGLTNPPPDVTVISSKGGRSTVPVAIVETANASPVITSISVTTASMGQLYSYDVNATDPDSDALTYSLVTSPAGMSINATTGLISWTPTSGQVGSHSVTVRASDPGGLFASQSFTITVSQQDTLTITTAQFTTRGNIWLVEGVSSPAPTQPRTVTVYLGPTVGGTVIGIANVASNGTWSFSQTNSPAVPATGQKISVLSSSGGKLENISVRIGR